MSHDLDSHFRVRQQTFPFVGHCDGFTQYDYITFIVIKKLCSSVKERTFKGRGVQPHPFVDPCDSRRREPAAETIWEPHFSNLYRYWLVFSQMPISILQAKLDENNSFFTCGFTCVPFFWEKHAGKICLLKSAMP